MFSRNGPYGVSCVFLSNERTVSDSQNYCISFNQILLNQQVVVMDGIPGQSVLCTIVVLSRCIWCTALDLSNE